METGWGATRAQRAGHSVGLTGKGRPQLVTATGLRGWRASPLPRGR